MNILNKIKSEQSRKALIVKIIIGIFISLGFAIISEKSFFVKYYPFFSIDRIIIITGVMFFILCHLMFETKKMYEFIFNKRYWLAGLFLIFVVIMQYSGSSITTYNVYIQPERVSEYDVAILGKERSIRSDEWLVSTQHALSQEKTENKYEYYSENARATDTDLFSTVNAPIKDIVSLGKPFNIGYMLFGNDAGLSFWWYGRLVALLLISFELCMIITDKKKLISLCGMLVITFSAAVQWWYSTSLVDMIIWGQLAIVLIDVFMKTQKLRTKILCAIGIFIAGISYVFVFYPAWQVSLGFVFLALFIWIILKNRKIYKFKKVDLIIVLCVILAAAGIGIRYYCMSKDTLNIIMNTSYPGERFEIGGKALHNLFSYIYGMFLPYSRMGNPCEYSGMLSLFPIPMIIAIIYMIRNKKGKNFLLPLLAVSVVYTIWVTVGTNELFAKLSLLYMTEPKRMTIPLGLAQIYMMIYLIANINKETKILPKKITLPIAFGSALAILYIAIHNSPPDYIGATKGFIGGMFVFGSIYYMLNMQEQEKKNGLLAILMIVAILTGATVNPIIKGTSVIYEKPFAKKVQEIVAEDKEAIWISDSTGIVGGNYLLANGAKVINSTNLYPNEGVYDIILKDKKEDYRTIWNRYSHMAITIVNTETVVELVQDDFVNIKLNYKALEELEVKYIASFRNNLEDLNSDELTFENIYEENGCTIYKVVY